VRVVRAVAEIFRDQQGLRESRDRARMKYLFLKEGWTAESFLAELQSRLDFTLLPGVPEQGARRHLPRPRRHSSAAPAGPEFRRSIRAARPADRRAVGGRGRSGRALRQRGLRTTVSQNLLFIDIPNSKTAELARELGKIGLQVDGSSFWRGAIACTGTEFCKLAITETKGFTRWLVDELEERLPDSTSSSSST
jgi:sulfite reductase (ferredoxin)